VPYLLYLGIKTQFRGENLEYRDEKIGEKYKNEFHYM